MASNEGGGGRTGGEGGGSTRNRRYLIVRPEGGGVLDLLRLLVYPSSSGGGKAGQGLFIESSGGGGDHSWVILVSIIVRKIIAFFGKPMEWTGVVVEWGLNLLSKNGGNLLALLLNILRGRVVMPQRGSDTFFSAIGHLDGRLDLYYYYNNNQTTPNKGDDDDVFPSGRPHVEDETDSCLPPLRLPIDSQAIMDLCMMASKLAYENANVVNNVVVNHWKMHFVEFYNCWNDHQKQRSTQVFILCDKPRDASLVLISFRGTEPFDPDDWSTDFDYSWYEIPKLGRVHMGFLEALGLGDRADLSTFQDHLQLGRNHYCDSGCDGPSTQEKDKLKEITAYHTVRSKLESLLDEHKKAKFLVTGHSLGGALAILFPAVLLLHEEEELIKRLLGVYTFGQPRVGDRQLGRFMEAHVCHPVSKYFRVVYCNDLVPRLPYDDKTFLFKHFGLCLYYNSFYVEQNMDEEPNRNYFGIRYLLPEYLNAVWELIRGLTMGYTHGAEYKEGWFCMLLRVVGLALPGISAHSPTDYVNCVRLGRTKVQMVSL